MTRFGLFIAALVLVAGSAAQAGQDIWRSCNFPSGHVEDAIRPGEYLQPGDCTDAQAQLPIFLKMQSDGNLVLYSTAVDPPMSGNIVETPIWSTSTAGSGAILALMWPSGNFTLYADGWVQIWTAYLYSGVDNPIANSFVSVHPPGGGDCGHMAIKYWNGTSFGINWCSGY